MFVLAATGSVTDSVIRKEKTENRKLKDLIKWKKWNKRRLKSAKKEYKAAMIAKYGSNYRRFINKTVATTQI